MCLQTRDPIVPGGKLVLEAGQFPRECGVRSFGIERLRLDEKLKAFAVRVRADPIKISASVKSSGATCGSMGEGWKTGWCVRPQAVMLNPAPEKSASIDSMVKNREARWVPSRARRP